MSSSPASIVIIPGAIDVAKYNKDWSFLVEMTLVLEKKNEIDKTHVSSVLGTLVEEGAPISDLRRLIDKSKLADASEKAGSEEQDSIFVTALKANADTEIVELLLGAIQDSSGFDVLDPFVVDPSPPQVSLATLKVLLKHPSFGKERFMLMEMIQQKERFKLLEMIQYIDSDDELVDKIILLMRVFVTGSVEPDDDSDKKILHYFWVLNFSNEGREIRLPNFTTILKEIIKKNPECCRYYFEDKYLPVHLCVSQSQMEALKLLIEEYPESAFVVWPERDMAPIHYLIRRRDFAPLFDKILDTVPLDRQCPRTGLFPALHVAATRASSQEDFHLECIYKLLRKDPMIVSSGTTGAGSSLLDDPDYLELCRKDRELSRIHYEHHARVTDIERRHKLQMEAIEMARKLQVEAIEAKRKLFRERVESKQT